MNKETPEYRAIEKAAQEYKNSGEGSRLDYIAGALSPEAKAFHQRWIPVTERLPQEHRRYLCLALIVNCYVEEVCLFDKSAQRWLYNRSEVQVTHWQEMPLAP